MIPERLEYGSYTSVTTGAGDQGGCGLTSDDWLECWSPRYNIPYWDLPELAKVAVGTDASCGVDVDGGLHCWGWWELDGQPEQVDVPTAPSGVVFTDVHILKPHLDPSYPPDTRLWETACALRSDGQAMCFGPGAITIDAPPAGETYTTISGQADMVCLTVSDGTATCFGVGPNVRQPPAPPSGQTFTRIAAGSSHGCALASDSTVHCWDFEEGYQWDTGGFSPPSAKATPVPVASGKTYTDIQVSPESTCAKVSDGSVSCWGTSDYVFNPPPTTLTYEKLSGGTTGMCAAMSDQTITCWGSVTRSGSHQ